MTKRSMKVRSLPLSLLAFGLLFAALPAHAVLTTDTTNIGKNPSFTTAYSAFWRTGFQFSVITEGTNTFINAPTAGGSVFIRHANATSTQTEFEDSGEVVVNSLGSYGVFAVATVPNSVGLQGQGTLYGVYGEPRGNQAGSAGVSGQSSSTNLSATGVSGLSNQGYGVYGTTSATGSAAGVRGDAPSGATGIWGSAGANGYGVYGEAAGTGFAVYGFNPGGAGWAGYFAGRAFTTAGVWSGSDLRLKKDIKDASYGLAQLLALRPVSFHWKKDESDAPNQLGLIAQEVQKIIPEVVVAYDKSGMLSVNYPELIPVMIKAIQEQQKRIDDLERGRAQASLSLLPGGVGTVFGLTLLPIGLIVGRLGRKKKSAN